MSSCRFFVPVVYGKTCRTACKVRKSVGKKIRLWFHAIDAGPSPHLEMAGESSKIDGLGKRRNNRQFRHFAANFREVCQMNPSPICGVDPAFCAHLWGME